MGLCLVQSRALLGLEAPAVTVEVHLTNGLPSFTLVGLAEVEVKEALVASNKLLKVHLHLVRLCRPPFFCCFEQTAKGLNHARQLLTNC